MNEKPKIEVPSIKELIMWHNQFGRMLKPNEKGTRLFGVDKKEVEVLCRSRPKYFSFLDRINEVDDSLGYCYLKREDGSKCNFRLDAPNGSDTYLTYAECDLVLGSNYYAIDEGYSSPSPFIRKVLFAVEANRPDHFNAFEIGDLVCGGCVRLPLIYYKIPKQRFRELRDYETNLDALVGAVKEERK